MTDAEFIDALTDDLDLAHAEIDRLEKQNGSAHAAIGHLREALVNTLSKGPNWALDAHHALSATSGYKEHTCEYSGVTFETKK